MGCGSFLGMMTATGFAAFCAGAGVEGGVGWDAGGQGNMNAGHAQTHVLSLLHIQLASLFAGSFTLTYKLANCCLLLPSPSHLPPPLPTTDSDTWGHVQKQAPQCTTHHPPRHTSPRPSPPGPPCTHLPGACPQPPPSPLMYHPPCCCPGPSPPCCCPGPS